MPLGCAPGNVKILLIGPRSGAHAGAPSIIGGTKVLFEELVRNLKTRGFALDILNTARPRATQVPWRARFTDFVTFAKVASRACCKIRRCDLVFLNVSSYSAWGSATAFWLLCRIARRPLVLKFFGAYLNIKYRNIHPWARWWAEKTFLQSDLIYVETRSVRDAFPHCANMECIPNTRDIAVAAEPQRAQARKLLFLGQLRQEKGWTEALEACRDLPEGCHLSVFGPGMLNTDFSLFRNHPKATYGGALAPERVPQLLCEHDLLLIPSYYRGEGHPGAAIEAFQCGMPVIATRWRAIPEVVQHEENGLLVEPRSVAELKAAILRLVEDADLYRALCQGAKRRGEYFRSPVWYDRMAGKLRGLVRQGPVNDGAA